MEGQLQRSVGQNFRILRLRQGLSQEAFADLLGLHRTLIGAIERGERNLTLRTVERLSDQLGVEPLELLTPPSKEVLRAAADGSLVGTDLRAVKGRARPKPRLR